jgi:imidazole glycerol-phosphate synthase subunit HisH
MNAINEKVTVIDYGAGNLGSVTNALARLGYDYVITGNPDDMENAAAVILPGVGAAGDTVKKLEESGLAAAIIARIKANQPLFAICVGLQVMLGNTEENGIHRCLGIVPGNVKKLPPGLKVPHMGWNQVNRKMEHPIFTGIPDGINFYFVHSYYADPEDKSVIAATTDYGVSFCSMIIKGNLIATQFHPEKSGEIGLRMYTNFLNMAFNQEKKQ